MTESDRPMSMSRQPPAPRDAQRCGRSHSPQSLDAAATGDRTAHTIGRRWFNTLWALPIGAAALVCLIALAQSPRELPTVAAEAKQEPE